MKQKALAWPKTPGRWSVRITVRFDDRGEVSMDIVDADPAKLQPEMGNIVAKLGVLGESEPEPETPPQGGTTK